MSYRRSRLAWKTERKSQKTFYLSVVGIIIILVLLLMFGTDALINFSVFMGNLKGGPTTSSSNNDVNYLAVPVLNPLPEATSSAQIIISGTSLKDRTIILYINNKEVDKTGTSDKGEFSFRPTLTKGNNTIQVLAEKNNKKSDFSNSYDVQYKDTPPTLEVSSPSDGQNFSKDSNTAKVSGKTESGASVTVNGFWAVLDENNNFSYNLPLQNGDNQIKIIATDQAGNKTEKTLKVTYSQ